MKGETTWNSFTQHVHQKQIHANDIRIHADSCWFQKRSETGNLGEDPLAPELVSTSTQRSVKSYVSRNCRRGAVFCGAGFVSRDNFFGKGHVFGFGEDSKVFFSLGWIYNIYIYKLFFLHYDHYECLHFRFPNIFFLPILPWWEYLHHFFWTKKSVFNDLKRPWKLRWIANRHKQSFRKHPEELVSRLGAERFISKMTCVMIWQMARPPPKLRYLVYV